MSIGLVISFPYLVQEFYKFLQVVVFEAIDVRLQVLMTEKCMKKWSILPAGGIKVLESLSDLGD
jgi:hypothetical protein